MFHIIVDGKCVANDATRKTFKGALRHWLRHNRNVNYSTIQIDLCDGECAS